MPQRTLLAAALAALLPPAAWSQSPGPLAATVEACSADSVTHADRVARLTAAGAQPMAAGDIPAAAAAVRLAFVLQQAAASGKADMAALRTGWDKTADEPARIAALEPVAGQVAFAWLTFADPAMHLYITTEGSKVSRTICFAILSAAPDEAALTAALGPADLRRDTAAGPVARFKLGEGRRAPVAFAVLPDPAAMAALTADPVPPAVIRIGGARTVPLAEAP